MLDLNFTITVLVGLGGYLIAEVILKLRKKSKKVVKK